MLIEKEHPAAIMFYLKTQCGWRETSDHVLRTDPNNPIRSVVTYLPDNQRRKGNGGA